MPHREPRKNKKPKPADSAALNALARLIDVRLPDGHGFCLLTFPLGPAIDPRCRYIGKGDRGDILKMMQYWLDGQNSGAFAFGEHSSAPEPTQWRTARPSEAGFYLMRHPDAVPSLPMLELVKLDVYDPHLGDFIILAKQLDRWKTTGATVEQTPDNTLWLGPIPEPWLAKAPAEIPEPADQPTDPDWKVGDNAPPVNVISPQFGEAVPPIERPEITSFFDQIETHHADAMGENAEMLLSGVSETGDGSVDRATLQRLVNAAFSAGVLAQTLNPLKL